jgi:hypothetical protein
MTVEQKRPAKSHRVRALNLLLVVASLGYIGYVVAKHVGDLQSARNTVDAAGIAGFILLATASISLSTIYHVMLVSTLSPNRIDKPRVGMAYSVGQIVRYLPGKVMGLLYQANVLRGEVPAAMIAFALIVQMLLAYACAGAIAFAVLASRWAGNIWPMLLLVPFAALVWLAQRLGWAQRAVRWLPLVGRHFGTTAPIASHAATTHTLTLMLFANWLPFLAGWAWLLRDTHPIGEAMVFAAAYLAASIASTAMIVVPSGIVVREAIFVWVGTRYGLPVSQLLFFALIARIALTCADVLNAGIFWGSHAWLARHRIRA